MRHVVIAVIAASAALSLVATPASAIPMSTSDLLTRQRAVSKVWCKRVCQDRGWCAVGSMYYRCCKRWTRSCW
jgi:hypothetical protein